MFVKGAFRNAGTAVAGLMLAIAVLACADGAPRLHASEAQMSAVPSAEEAIRLEVEDSGAMYAGDCARTRSPDDLGKVCSKLIDERGTMRAYLIGRTFSEFSTWVFVERGVEGWSVAGTEPLDFFSTTISIPWPN